MAYYQAKNTGLGFITHQDSAAASFREYPGDIWETTNVEWATRVGAVEKTKYEAQHIVNVAMEGATYPEGHEKAGQQIIVVLE